jgi:transcriptional regulator with XRE-family HTH domain
MNSHDFGKLVKALREEIYDENEEHCTQEKLAKETNLSAQVIANIEQGRRRPDTETLLVLAEALRLTSGERKEFFLAASGVDYRNIAHRAAEPRRVLGYLMRSMKEVHLPAYIIDSFCEVIVANGAVIRLLDLASAGLDLDKQRQKPFGLNMMQFVFSHGAVEHYRKLMGEKWENYAYQNMMILRTYALRYRFTEYFRGLLQVLRNEYPLFRKYWREWRDPYWREDYFDEKDHFIDNEHIHLNSPEFGPLVYFSTSITALTTLCDLHFCTYVPATFETALAFRQMTGQGGAEIIKVSRWPEDHR